MHRRRAGHRPAARQGLALAGVAAGVLALAALSLLAPSQPTYDPWAWLLWGREVAALDLSTIEGPAFKPLPVAVAALLSAFGDAAPALWLVVARAGALCAVLLGARVAWTLSAGSRAAALAGGGAVALTAGFAWHASTGGSEPLFAALALGAIDRGLAGRHGVALALGCAAGLLRPESWLFLVVYGAWLWRAQPPLRAWLAAAPPALLALWFGPELWGTGDLLRSGERARVPNPGAPATASRPALASLEAAAALALWPLLAGLLLARGRRVLMVAGAGAAWVAIVAVMAEGGTSGEPRYALPGVIVLGVGAAAGLGRAARWQLAVLALVLVPFAVARAGRLGDELRTAAGDARLYGSLDDAVAAAGGRDAVLRCGPPVTGRLRGPAVAYALRVHKEQVDFDPAPGRALFHSRIRSAAPVAPPIERSARLLGRSARWQIRCDRRVRLR